MLYWKINMGGFIDIILFGSHSDPWLFHNVDLTQTTWYEFIEQ